MPICQCCKHPIAAGQAVTACPAPKPGATWYVHANPIDCALALLRPELAQLRQGERRAA